MAIARAIINKPDLLILDEPSHGLDIEGKEMTVINIVHFIISMISGSGLIAFSTYYISDYSKTRNIISSIGGSFNLAILIYVIVTKGRAEIIYSNIVLLFGMSIILGVASIVMVCKYSRIEAFVNNIKKSSDSYNNKNYIDE